MSDFLVRHALKNVWCSPRQDLQIVVTPQRISDSRGIRGGVEVMWEWYNLPTPGDVYHVYMVGAYPAHLMGLNPQRGVWRTAGKLMEEEFLMCDIYTNEGLHFVRSLSWFLITPDGALLLAVREQNKIANLRTTPVHFRLYSNAFEASRRSDNFELQIRCVGRRVTDHQQALEFQREYHQVRDTSPGYTWLFVNGAWVDDYPPSMVVPGDYVEYVNDPTVIEMIDYAIADLPTFDSALDSNRKYLICEPGPVTDVGNDFIRYRDDIDVYLYRPSNAHFDGVYMHKNRDESLRMVTHRDYSIPINHVVSYQLQRPGWDTSEDLRVRLFVRAAGYERPLVFEHHRIQELYKLPPTERKAAMLGVDSTVDVWRADALENSYYTKIMGLEGTQITNEMVKEAYGYNAISKLIGDTPQRVQVVSGRRVVELPFGMHRNSTVYELNHAGKLIQSYIHTAGSEYTPFNIDCQMIEVIAGRGGSQLEMHFDQSGVVLDPLQSYRFYIAPISHGEVRQEDWQDVTGDDSKVLVLNGRAYFQVDTNLFSTCVKSDKLLLDYERAMTTDNGLLRFSITAFASYPTGYVNSVLYIPPGRLDLWLNNEVLIEGLDYVCRWPEVVITNKAYLVGGQTQMIRVRASGFCTPDMQRQPIKEYGFVQYGRLSRNSRYDLRDDRVIRLVVGGRTYHRSDLKFTEDDRLMMTNVPNGSPYLLDDLVVPLRGVVSEDTYSMRAESLIVDQQISDYLTLKLPQPEEPNPDQIPERYAIFSPFASTVMYDLMNSRLSTDEFKGQYSDQKLRDYLSSYEWLLDYDPARLGVDDAHVSIHPHDRWVVQELDIYQYRMLSRAIKIFLDDKVDITRFVRVKDSYI